MLIELPELSSSFALPQMLADGDVQLLSHVRLFVNPWTAACQASLSFSISQSLLKLMSIESVMPSNHLIFCHPAFSSSIFPSIVVFSNESALHIRWPKYWSFSFSVSIRPSNEYSGWISFRMDWFDLLTVQVDDDNEENNNQLLSTSYVSGTQLGSLHVLSYSVHCSQHPLASDEMKILSKKLSTSANTRWSESCQGGLRGLWKGFGVFRIPSNSVMSLEIM